AGPVTQAELDRYRAVAPMLAEIEREAGKMFDEEFWSEWEQAEREKERAARDRPLTELKALCERWAAEETADRHTRALLREPLYDQAKALADKWLAEDWTRTKSLA